jgi:mycoredoxin
VKAKTHTERTDSTAPRNDPQSTLTGKRCELQVDRGRSDHGVAQWLVGKLKRTGGKDLEAAVVTATVTDESSSPTAAEPVLTVYWRPGCPFCSSLFSQLDRAKVPYQTANIWEDPEAAATVRSIARGNETVPTVTVGEAGLVNPDLHEIMAVAANLAPQLIPVDYEAPQPGRIAQWIHTKLAGGDN